MNAPISHKIMKLTNGEEIVCQMDDKIVNDEYQLNYPLKIDIRPQMTKKGVVEALNLSRWVGSYTSQSLFSVKTEHVLLVAEASEGLCRYYDHVVEEIKRIENKAITKAISINDYLDDIDDEDVYDELLDKSLSSDDTIH
ncbi:MAG: hypothetical protein QGH26_03265 [Candidatus Pacebacteria bacterium]|nr:hypothetical protein [Candidatus Paceibacterota bacterium]